ncbi:MAG: nitrite reductase small subunit NirD [Okeania sp. SIO2C9]|uniref:nitrite reductase small subunit NirD n=1 Tax=Okeania sp. SIO2C9 TaxID=2607791 RepID=UPI0013C15A2F|nr:nitrite reductase small subunit NirD [Okeania sp. SIO2C9]NEQ78653.1 nitrite reductase small subunit NirD [Okeania sp. SIO2C9]
MSRVICKLSDITPNTGVCALVEDEQVAIFRVEDKVYALSNLDPFSKAMVLSRGLIGSKGGVLKVSSPLYKQSFALEDGRCLDDETVSLPTWAVSVSDSGEILLGDKLN